jgi:hypothetical protein
MIDWCATIIMLRRLFEDTKCNGSAKTKRLLKVVEKSIQMTIRSKLIYDIGFQPRRHTKFCIALGIDVIAKEANPLLIRYDCRA